MEKTKIVAPSLNGFDIEEVLQNKLRTSREATPEVLQTRNGVCTTPEGHIVYVPARYIPKSGWMKILAHRFGGATVSEAEGTPVVKEIVFGKSRRTEVFYTIEINYGAEGAIRVTGTYQLSDGDDLERGINIASGNALARGVRMLGVGNDIPWDEIALCAPKFIAEGQASTRLVPYKGDILSGGKLYSNDGELMGDAPIVELAEGEEGLSLSILCDGEVPNDEGEIAKSSAPAEAPPSEESLDKQSEALSERTVEVQEEETAEKLPNEEPAAPAPIEPQGDIKQSLMDALFGEPEEEPEEVVSSEPTPDLMGADEVLEAEELVEEPVPAEEPKIECEDAKKVVFATVEGEDPGNMAPFIGMPMGEINRDIISMISSPSYKEAALRKFPAEVVEAAEILAAV